MMKLKTLKDLSEKHIIEIFPDGDRCNFGDDEDWINPDELKQEAIKWIKESRTLRAKGKSDCNLREGSWMDFFNISEDDIE